MGGNDQWGNIIAGIRLCNQLDNKLVNGITWPLITTAMGQKMGKTASGAVWLDATLTSPYDFFQYWINTHDDDVKRFLAYFTFLPMDQINELTRVGGESLRAAKERRAYEATSLAHGAQEADKARALSRAAFGGASAEDLAAIPSSPIARDQLRQGILLVDLLAQAKMVSSKSEARRLIEQGGVSLNGKRFDDVAHRIDESSLENDSLLLKAGKRKLHRFIVQ
jgi:tyrosyl-tRNA synthetase